MLARLENQDRDLSPAPGWQPEAVHAPIAAGRVSWAHPAQHRQPLSPCGPRNARARPGGRAKSPAAAAAAAAAG